MFRRVLAACLAVCIVLLAFGCGQKPSGEPKTTRKSVSEDGTKIAIVIGDSSQSPEVFAAASEIAKTYDESVMIVKYAEDYYKDYSAVSQIATTVAENDAVKAIVFADGVKGTGEAVRAVREAREDMCIVVCDPHEGSVEMKGADLILSVDFPALGQAMVDKAKEMGAEHFVFYSTNRHLKYSSVAALRRAAELACEEAKMTFKAAASVDPYDEGRDLAAAKQYLAEDTARKLADFGEKTAMISTEPQAQGALAAQAIRHGMTMPATFLPSALSLAADLGVDLTGHETDSAYAMQQLKASDAGAAGHVATWGFSAPIAFLSAAFDYASLVLRGEGKAATTDSVQALLTPYTAGADVTVTTDANGAYLVQSDLVTL